MAEAEDALGSRIVRCVTLLMTALAAVAVALAIAEPERSIRSSIVGSLSLMIPVAASAWVLGKRASRRRGGPEGRTDGTLPPGMIAGLLAVFILSFGVEFFGEVLSGRRVMLEILLIAAMRNLALGMAALSHRPALARLCVLLDLFLVCVSSPMAEGTPMIAVVALFAAAGCLWLLVSSRGSFRLIEPAGERGRFPVATVAFIMAIVGAVCVAAAVGPTRAATALIGLMPTSGGTDWNDPESLGGVNDGDNEVSASENPQSVGFTESEVYLESDRPSLYDAFSEQYGEAFKPRKQERMIALGQQEIVEQKERPSENLQAGRQFPMVRRKPIRPGRRPGEREAKALVYVKGPCPLHIPLAAYDRFDGEAWTEGTRVVTRRPLEREGRGAWLRTEGPRSPAFAGKVTHQVKIGTLDSSPLPVPTQTVRLRVGSVAQPDFFSWGQEGIVKMEGRTVPAGTLIDAESLTVDPSRIDPIEFPESKDSLNDRYLISAEDYRVDPAIAELASSWVSGHPRGWGQVKAVVSALRVGCVHDRFATLPEGCPDPVRHFLLDSRRGADYQFATAAAVVLRLLGYPSRVLSGLYASPDRYNPRTRHTPVLGEDAHFWVEVRLRNGVWIPIEPTPGYSLLAPVLSWSQMVANSAAVAAGWARTHWMAIAAIGISLALAIWLRRELADAVLTLAWRLSPRGDPSRHLVRTFRLVERRSRWAGCPRPGGVTPRKWYGLMAAGVETVRIGEFAAILGSVERSFYAAGGASAASGPGSVDPIALCRRVVETWTLSRLRASRAGSLS